MSMDYTHHLMIGAGSFGTTIAKVISDAQSAHDDKKGTKNAKNNPIKIYARRPEQLKEINSHHTNHQYLPGIKLPHNLEAGNDLAQLVPQADVIWVAVPAQQLRENIKSWRQYINEDTVVVSLIKGMEDKTNKTMTEVLAEELPISNHQIAAMSGPNLAMEIAQEQPAAAVVASEDPVVAQQLSEAATSAYFKVDPSSDVIGVEVGGIVKNIIALAIGMCAGKGWGENTKSSILTRGYGELINLSKALGGRLKTATGLAGIGDLVATCSSELSRNYKTGYLLGQGLSIEQASSQLEQVAEGVKSVGAVVDIAQKNNVDMPISTVVKEIIEGSASVDQLGQKLMLEVNTVSKKSFIQRLGTFWKH